MKLREAVYLVLQEAEGPMRAGEITQRIQQQELVTSSAVKLENSVRTALRRIPDFVKKGHGQYTLFRRENPGGAFVRAAEFILEEFGNGQPMYYREVTQLALSRGLISKASSTPHATLHARVSDEIRSDVASGRQPRFYWLGVGMVGLTRHLKTSAQSAHESEALYSSRAFKDSYKKAQEKLLEFLTSGEDRVKANRLEDIVYTLLTKMGVDIGEEGHPSQKRSGDGGVDIRGKVKTALGEFRIAVEVKCRPVGKRIEPREVRSLLGSIQHGQEQAVFITTGRFASSLEQEEAGAGSKVILIDGEKLFELMLEYEVGVRREENGRVKVDTKQLGLPPPPKKSGPGAPGAGPSPRR